MLNSININKVTTQLSKSCTALECAGSEASSPASLSWIAGHILTLGVLSSLHLEVKGEFTLVKDIFSIHPEDSYSEQELA